MLCNAVICETRCRRAPGALPAPRHLSNIYTGRAVWSLGGRAMSQNTSLCDLPRPAQGEGNYSTFHIGAQRTELNVRLCLVSAVGETGAYRLNMDHSLQCASTHRKPSPRTNMWGEEDTVRGVELQARVISAVFEWNFRVTQSLLDVLQMTRTSSVQMLRQWSTERPGSISLYVNEGHGCRKIRYSFR